MCQAVQEQTESTKNLKNASAIMERNYISMTKLMQQIDELPDDVKSDLADVVMDLITENKHEA